MLIVSGTAEFNSDKGQFNKGEKHLITIFSNNENLEDNLSSIEVHLNQLGLDNIFIEESELVDDKEILAHSVLKDGFDKAINQGLAVVVNNVPLAA